MGYTEPTEEELASLLQQPVNIPPPIFDENSLGYGLDFLPEASAFQCSICGLSKKERYNPTSRYCVDCYKQYTSWRGKVKRKQGDDADVTMKRYREWRETEGLPVSLEAPKRGRRPRVDPDDLTAMSFVQFWRYVASKAHELHGQTAIYIEDDNGEKYEVTPKGLYPAYFQGGRDWSSTQRTRTD